MRRRADYMGGANLPLSQRSSRFSLCTSDSLRAGQRCSPVTWAQAKIEALRLVEEIGRKHGEPAEIQLTIYPSEASYRQQKPYEAWPWEFHTQVTRSTYRELLKRGYNAKLVTYEP